jgi:U3 small nucleolar RNA-associated protein 20
VSAFSLSWYSIGIDMHCSLIPALVLTLPSPPLLVKLLSPIIAALVQLGLTSKPSTVEKAFQTLAFLFKDLGKEMAQTPTEIWAYVREGMGAGLPMDSQAGPTDDTHQDERLDHDQDGDDLEDVEAEEETPVETADGADSHPMDVDEMVAPPTETDTLVDIIDEPEPEPDSEFPELETSTSTLRDSLAGPRLAKAPKAQLRHLLASAFAFFIRKVAASEEKLDALWDVILDELVVGSESLAESVAWIISETCKVCLVPAVFVSSVYVDLYPF